MTARRLALRTAASFVFLGIAALSLRLCRQRPAEAGADAAWRLSLQLSDAATGARETVVTTLPAGSGTLAMAGDPRLRLVLQGVKQDPEDRDLTLVFRLPAGGVEASPAVDDRQAGSDRELEARLHCSLEPAPDRLRGGGAWYDLTTLSAPSRRLLSLVLLLPFGALLTAAVRTLVGVRVFGTFTPPLIGLSVYYGEWLVAPAVFLVILTTGLSGSRFVERLRLLLVPRLSLLLTGVVLVMVFAAALSERVGLQSGSQAILLPMVILTMLIERLSVVQQEEGSGEAWRLLLQTALLALATYLILGWDWLGRLVLTYPEIHAFTLALLILLGRYTGYRLSELWRFRDLREGTP